MFLQEAAKDMCPYMESIESVGFNFFRMMTSKLVDIRLDPCLKILKEYRGFFNSEDLNYKKFDVVIRRIEHNRFNLSRFDLSQLCYDVLTPMNQFEYLASVAIAMENPLTKKEMNKLASDTEGDH
jgi:hypothetical protein